MSKWLKTFYFIVSLLLLFLCYSIVVSNYSFAFLPREWHDLVSKKGYYLPFFYNKWVATLLLWAAVVFAVVLLIAIIIILLYPRLSTEIKLSDKEGKLFLKKSALEGYVKAILAENRYMENPSVTIKLFRRKFKVNVTGKLLSRENITEKTEKIGQEIRSGLNDFFGIDHKVKFHVQVKNLEEQQTEKKHKRVL